MRSSTPRPASSPGARSRMRRARWTGGYRVTARWDFASGSRQASWLGAHVRIVGADGVPRKNADGSPELRTILFPVASATLHDVWEAIGLAGTGTGFLRGADLFIPERFTAFRDVPSALRETRSALQDRHRGQRSASALPRSRSVWRVRRSMRRLLWRAKSTSRSTAERDARQPGGPGPDRPHRGRPTRRARLSLRDRACDVARPLCDRRVQRGASQRGAAAPRPGPSISRPRWSTPPITWPAPPRCSAATRSSAAFRDMHAIAQQIQARDTHYEDVGKAILAAR